MIHVLASIKVKPGKRDILIEHLKSNIPNVIKENGCIEYNPTIDMDYHMDNQTFDENMVTIIEKWENFDTLKNHMLAVLRVAGSTSAGCASNSNGLHKSIIL